jgi:hypothetical protein
LSCAPFRSPGRRRCPLCAAACRVNLQPIRNRDMP